MDYLGDEDRDLREYLATFGWPQSRVFAVREPGENLAPTEAIGKCVDPSAECRSVGGSR